MARVEAILTLFLEHNSLARPATWLAIGLVLASALLVATKSLLRTNAVRDIPLINPQRSYDLGGIWTKVDFVLHARNLLTRGIASGRPFRLSTDLGEMIILPARFATEIRSDPRLSFAEVIEQNFHSRFPGFEGFRMGTTDARLSRDVANKQLTHSLASVTPSLSDECDAALNEYFPASEEWTDIGLRENVLQLVARLSSRVFLGSEGARNEAWIRITTEYTKTAYIAAYMLRLWPRALRPFAHWLIPHCWKLRAQVAEARCIIVGLIEKRNKSKAAAKQAGQLVPSYSDAIEWFQQDLAATQDGRYDPVVAQLILAQAAIETTTDFLTQAILDIAQHPELVAPLRAEVAAAVGEGSWQKSSNPLGAKICRAALRSLLGKSWQTGLASPWFFG